MSIEGQCHFFTIYFPGFVCFVLYLDKISGERLQDHWSSGYWLSWQHRCLIGNLALAVYSCEGSGPSSTFLVNGDAYILPDRLHTYLGLNVSGSPY